MDLVMRNLFTQMSVLNEELASDENKGNDRSHFDH